MTKQLSTKAGSAIISPQYDGLLTIEEIKRLTDAPCLSPVVRRAALFCLHTGLRYEVIQNLRWENIIRIRGKTHIHYRHPEYGLFTFPITSEAMSFCDQQQHSCDLLFSGLPDVSWLSLILNKWAKAASIRHRLTFYGLRLTYSIMLHHSNNQR